jgi:large subunit ribosomal protein L10Ae
MSKIPPQVLQDAIKEILTKRKQRKFTESIDLQVNLKNYDPQKDKRFAGTLRLPNLCRPNMRIGIICDLQHEEQAKKQNLTTLNMEDLKKLNKNKKLVKKLCTGYDAFLASESIIKTIPRVVGPHLNRLNKFPTSVALGDNLSEKAQDLQATIKFQLKKVLCLGCCIGHVNMKEDEIRQNTVLAINYFVSLLKKNWQNMKSAYLKSTMGKPQRLY